MVLAGDQIKEWICRQMAFVRGVVLYMATPTHRNCLPPDSYKMSMRTGEVWPFLQIDVKRVILPRRKPTL